MNELAPPYRLIRDRLFAGKVIPFLGSGASLRSSCGVWERCADATALQNAEVTCYLHSNKCSGFTPPASGCLPKAAELACYLARMTNFPTGESIELTKVAQYFDIVGGRPSLNDELHSIFNKDYHVTPLHKLLAEVPGPLLIVTTNYDDLIERAFDEKSRKYDIVIHTTHPTQANNILYLPHGAAEPESVVTNKFFVDLDTTTVIYKMHGAVDRSNSSNDQYVITEDDYINFLTRMTKGRVIPAIFSEFFESRSFLFFGYGLHDWNLRVVLKRIEKEMNPFDRPVSWAIQYNPSALEKRFWANRRVEVFDIQIEEFMEKLLQS